MKPDRDLDKIAYPDSLYKRSRYGQGNLDTEIPDRDLENLRNPNRNLVNNLKIQIGIWENGEI